VDESRWLAAQGATAEALDRVDEALCEALDPPSGYAVSSSYLDWVSGLIAEAQALEQDLDLLAGAQDGELVDLPPLEIASDLDAADADIEESPLPLSDVPIDLNPTVLRFLEAMTDDTEYRRRIEVGLGRAGSYLPMIRSKLVNAGLPTDLAYLPLIESAFSPSAYSRARAVGMWQFISSTGRHYGLSVGSLVDERRDPELSTDAAIAYLTDLYGEFDDWSLALAAYNSGAGNVRRAIRRSGSRDFWKLKRYLPRETRNYVPAYMASVIVAKDPDAYGFEAPLESDWSFDRITVSDALDLEFLAGKIDLDVATLRELNPAIRRDLTPASGRTTIRLPVGYGLTAESVLEATPKSEWAPRMMHTVRRGESLYSIAMRYGSNVSAIRQANGIRGNLIHPGQTLVVPRFGDQRPQPTRRLAGGGTYVVQRHDTLWDISRSFGTSVDALCAANGLSRRSTIRPGQRLVIPDGGRAAAPSSKTATYTVRRGDTLSAIARRHGVSVSDLRRVNGLSGSRIYPGDQLRIPSSRARG
jgi:membrane-bound lytic murein transglycosylase D